MVSLRNSAFSILAIVLLSACNGKGESDALSEKNNKETGEVITPLPRQIQNTVAIQRHFSSTIEKDEFIITIRGENYLKAKVCFSIINNAGDTLFVRHS
ncbi:MAG TPA: hypothetical protein PK610_13230, partial [Flavobacteriales bacterium]|nr:hypothetical protein [Flavobacteriales bacterium]